MTERPARSTPSRQPVIANLSSVGILLVVLGHSLPDTTPPDDAPARLALGTVIDLVYLFHMPLFFFVSGYLFVHTAPATGRFDYRRFVAGKARRLLLPYWVISSVAFPLKTLMKDQAARPVDFTLFDYLRSMLVPWQNTIIFFWFLPTLFLIFVAAPLLLAALRRRSWPVHLLVTAGLVALSLSIEPVFWNDPLNYRGAASHAATFWIGMVWRAYEPPLSTASFGGIGLAATALFVLGVLVGAPSFPAGKMALAWSGVAACLGLVGCATALGLARIPSIDGRSFQIYLLSWFPQIFVKIVVFRWLGLNFWGAALLMFATGIGLPLMVSSLVARRLPRLKPVLGL